MKKLSHDIRRVNLLAFMFAWTIGACTSSQLLPESSSNPASVSASESELRSSTLALGAEDETSRAIAARLKETKRSTEKTDTNHSGDAEQPQESSERSNTKYACSMHPEVVRNEAGKCPICGMTLIET